MALVQHYDGRMRVLERGWHLLDTVYTSVRKARLTEDVISEWTRASHDNV